MKARSKKIRWNRIFRWLVPALILANMLLATGTPAVAQGGPTLHVVPTHPEVHGHDWPGDAVVTLIIDGDTNPDNGILYTDWKYASDDPWCGTPCFDLQGVFDLQPGHVVTMSDAETFKLVTVTSLQVTAVDPDADTVSGTATPYSAVQVDIHDEGGVSRSVTADDNGDWVADFSVFGDEGFEQNTYDLVAGSQGRAIQFEVEGWDDGTLAYWAVPNPRFEARPEEDQIDGWEWQPGAMVTLSIDGAAGDYGEVQETDEWGNVSFPLQGNFDIQVGDVVTLSDSDSTKVHTVINLAVSGMDAETDTVWGTADPDSQITVWTHDGRANIQVPANAEGNWSADLSEWVDLGPGSGGGAAIQDDDQDSTAVYWWIPSPRFSARPQQDQLSGWEWSPNSSVAITINSYSASAYTDEWGNFDLHLEGFDLQSGQTVIVSDGASTREHIITNLTVTAVDVAAETVSGTADAGSRVQAWICDEAGCANREETADSGGFWTADFSVAGDQDGEQDIRDIQPGTGGDSGQWDDDGDSTNVGWQAPNPTFAAHPDEDRVDGWEWPLGETVTLEIDNPGNGPGVDYSATQTAGIAEWDPNQTYVQFDFRGVFDLQSEYVVSLNAGTMTKSHVVTNLAITEVNPGADTVSGTAVPGTNVDISSCDDQGCANRHVVAEDGTWLADFAHEGPGDDEQDTLDIVNGTGGDAAQYDQDGDSTQIRWEEAHPRLEVSYEHDWIQIRGFTPGGNVTYTIFDYEGGHELFGPVTGPVDSHGDGWISSNLHHTDLIPGNYVVAVNEASGEEVSLLIRDVNLDYVGVEDNVAFGTAEPNSTIELNIGETHDGGFSLTVPVDGDGNWYVDLAAAGNPISEYRHADARLYDEEGDQIIAQNPRIHAQVRTDSFGVDNFSKNADVTFTLYDSPGGNTLYGPETLRTDSSGNAWVNLWEHEIDLQIGHYITAHDHALGFTKALEIELYTFDEINTAEDYVRGTSLVDEWVELHVESLFSNWGMDALTDEYEQWYRDYGAENYDITDQMWGYGWAIDDQGNWSEDHITGLPNIEASPADDWISGFNFTPDRPVRIEIYASEGGALLDSLQVTADGNTQFWVGNQELGFDLQAGMYLEVVDLETGKESSLTLAFLTFDGVDYDTETAWGQADPGTQVVVRADRLFDHYELMVIADEDGRWFADLAPLGADLTPEWSLRAMVFDGELDATVADAPRPPEFTAAFDQDWVNGNSWSPNAEVEIEVFEYEGGPALGAPIDWGTDGYGNFHVDLWGYGVDLQPGQHIVVTDTATGQSKATTLVNLTIDNVDPDNELVEGFAPGDTRITVNCWNDSFNSGFDLFSDDAGNWVADFGAHDIDLTPDTSCDARIYDEDNDATQANWHFSMPTFAARPVEDAVEGWQWPFGAEVTITVDSKPECTGSTFVVEAPWDPQSTWFRAEFEGECDLGTGDTVTVSDGQTTKIHVVTGLQVDGVDAEANTVYGTADPGSEVNLWIHGEEGTDLWVTADSGDWTADFTGKFNLQPGTGGAAVQQDDDGDQTWIDWQVPNPTFLVRLMENEVHGYEWPINATVTLIIDDPGTTVSPDFSDTGNVEEAPWDPEQTFVRFGYPGTLQVGEGFLVTMSDGAVTKTHMVTSLTLESVDAGTDLVTGTAKPGSEVNIAACDDFGCASRTEIVSAEHTWSANFSVPGEEDWEQDTFDIGPGTGGEAVQQDEDGDGTQVGWWISIPVLHVVPAHPEIHGHEWDWGASVTLTIEDPQTGASYEGSQTVGDETWCGTPCFDLLGVFDVQPGQVVTMSDGQTTRTVHVTSLVVTDVDATYDTISGTADPHSDVWVDVHEVEGFSRHVTADGSGHWLADFSVPGDENFEQGVYDLEPGSHGRAIQFEVEGWDDGTLAYWGIPVGNEPPTIEGITAPVEPVAISGQPVGVEVAFSDPDEGDAHAITWDWGDGTSDTQSKATSPSSAEHTYAEPGVYPVKITVTDSADATATAVYEFIVIYDPEGGFVTGGGWIWSPAGAYTADPTLEGKASFGFVSKYKKGAQVPEGQTQFQFKAGDLNFHSDSYDWLVVAGAKAMFKGVGTINGAGNYGFMLSAIDSALTPSTDVDLFRIKIWDRDNGDAVIYDNLLGASEDADPTTAIGGGNIVVHKAK